MIFLGDWTLAALIGGTGFTAVGGVVKVSRLIREKTVAQDAARRNAEAEAYAELDPALAPQEPARSLARRVCATVAKYSPFNQVAMFMPDAESRLHMAGSSGVDDLEAIAVGGKVARFARERRRRVAAADREFDHPVMLDIEDESLPGSEEVKQVIVIPMWSHAGEMMGALALWRRVSRTQQQELTEVPAKELLEPVQTLAQRLGRSLDLNRMSAKLLASERLARLTRVGRLSVI